MRTNLQFADMLKHERVIAGVWRNPANLTFALLELEALLTSCNEVKKAEGVRRLTELHDMVAAEYRSHFGEFDDRAELPHARTLVAAHLPRYMKLLHVEMRIRGIIQS